MRRLMFILLLLVIVSLPTAAAQNDPTCDPSAYLEMRQADIAELGRLIQTGYETEEFGDLYLELITYRTKYEDMVDVPECVEELHRLTLAQITANQDVIGLALLSILSGDENNPYDELMDSTTERLAELRDAALAEVERLQEQ